MTRKLTVVIEVLTWFSNEVQELPCCFPTLQLLVH